MKWITKKRFYIPAVILLLIFVLLFFASDMARNYIEKNSKELIGRTVQLNELHFNYFNVSVQAKGFKLFEENDDEVFAGFRELLVDFQPWNLLHGEYAFSQILIDSAYVSVVKSNQGFNFDSLIPQDTTSVADTLETNSDIKFLIENIQLINGRVDFYDATVNNRMIFDNLSLTLPQIAWNKEESKAGVNFKLGEDGEVHVAAQMNQANNEYLIDFRTSNIDINFAKNYLLPYLNINKIAGNLDLNLKIKGSTKEYEKITIRGNGRLANFAMTDSADVEFIKSKQIEVVLDSLDLQAFQFSLDTIHVIEPYLFASLLPQTTNIERILEPTLTSLETEAQVDSATQADEQATHYRINHLQIEDGEVLFTDNTLNRPFHYTFKDVSLTMSNLSDLAEAVNTQYTVNLNDLGELKGNTTFSMLDPYHLHHHAQISRLQLQSFSPYSEYFVAHGITGGHFTYDFSIEMSRTKLLNNNNVKIQDLTFGKRTADTTATKLPIRFALYLLKDKNDKIAFELPVTGNPSDPEFKLGKIIWKTVANFLVKTATTPFNALASLAGGDPNSLKNVEFKFLQDSIDDPQKTTLDKIINISQQKPELLFVFEQYTDADHEREMISIAQAKKMMMSAVPPSDSLATEPDETAWTQWLNAKHPDLSASIESRCKAIVGQQKVEELLTQKMNLRNESIKSYLETKGMAPNAYRIQIADLKNMTPEMKKPHYKVEAELP